jgi:hypothetical protein
MILTMKIASLSAAISALFITNALATDYPFTLPESVNASIAINTNNQERFNNRLLATNIFGFTSATEQELIEIFNPNTIRFPHGLWANWYDWRTDHTRQYGGDRVTFTNSLGASKTRTLDHLSSIQTFERLEQKIGISGLTQLNTNRLQTRGTGYDMVWTFNMSADGEYDSTIDNGSPESVARYQDLLSRGLEVKDIEMGNENFYPGQRSTIIPGVNDYIARAKVMSKDLKALNPNLQLSVPLLRKANTANPNYNELVAADSNYFDAVTVHTYVGSDPDNAEDSDEAFGTALVARAHIANSVNNYSKVVAPNKPIWLTEWGVKSGGPNAASVLGMADVYMFMSENQETYHRANWFSVNGKLNSFLQWETYTAPSGVERPRIKYPLEKTLFGSTHEIIRLALQDSVLLDSTTISPELELGVQAITARAVLKDNRTQLLVINKTNQAAPFTIDLDGLTYTGSYQHKTLSFESLSEERLIAIDADPLTILQNTQGAITLPKYSISIITLDDLSATEDLLEITLDTDSKQYVHDVNDPITFVATPSSSQTTIQSVTFEVAGQDPVVDNQAPFELVWQPTSIGRKTITAKVTDNASRVITSSPLRVNVEGEILPEQEVTTQIMANSSSTEVNQAVMLTASASVNYGNISLVELYIDGALITTFTEAPYSYEWTPTEVKTSFVYVKAISEQLKTSTSDSVNVVVTAAPVQAATPTTPQPASNTNTNNAGSESNGGSGGSFQPLWMLILLLIMYPIKIRRKLIR